MVFAAASIALTSAAKYSRMRLKGKTRFYLVAVGFSAKLNSAARSKTLGLLRSPRVWCPRQELNLQPSP